MPLPKPRANETKPKYISRCMADPKMREEFPDEDQRFAVCQQSWRERAKAFFERIFNKGDKLK